MLNSAIAVVSEYGYSEMSVARITGAAGVSRRTFYDLFEDREDCFLAAFDQAAARVGALMGAAYEEHTAWGEQVRGALLALLGFLDQQPGVARLLVVDALKAGPRVQERRGEILAWLSQMLHESGSRARAGKEPPALTGEGIVGGVLGVIHTRLQGGGGEPLVSLINELMSVIFLPYLGAGAAHRELQRPAPRVPRNRRTREQRQRPGDVLAGLPMRITYRTLMVLKVIAEHPGASNREVASLAGVSDQGQISKLLARMRGLGLIENRSPGQPSGEPNEWQLTPLGHQVQHAIQRPTSGQWSDHDEEEE